MSATVQATLSRWPGGDVCGALGCRRSDRLCRVDTNSGATTVVVCPVHAKRGLGVSS